MTKVLAFIAAFFLSGSALAQQDLAPDQLVQKITNDVLAAIKSDKDLAAGDKQKALKLAEDKILPYIDFEHATRLAVGRAWSQATPEQKKKLVGEFRSMLVRTYSNGVGAYQGQTLKVLPSRGKADPEDTVVRTQFNRALLARQWVSWLEAAAGQMPAPGAAAHGGAPRVQSDGD